MKEHRQMYLLFFLAYCIFTVLLFLQRIAPRNIPHLFASAGAVLIGTVIGEVIRARKAKLPWSRLIPAAIMVLVALAQAIGFFGWFSPVTGHETEVFLFYLITSLINVVASAVGFFLK